MGATRHGHDETGTAPKSVTVVSRLCQVLSWRRCGDVSNRDLQCRMPRRFALGVLVVLASCGASSSEAATPAEAARPAPVPAAAPEAEQLSGASRCLPVVSVECGCVYDCGVGGPPDASGVVTVNHAFWSEPITARVQQWCVNGECTEAFAAELVCGVICDPKPADPTCAFRQGRCGSALSDPAVSP